MHFLKCRYVHGRPKDSLGYQTAKVTGVMNMRPPMIENCNRYNVVLVRRAAKANCKQRKTNVREEVKTVYEPKEEVLV